MNNSELCIPASALSQAGEDGQSVGPEVGDAVEVSIAGTISRSEGGNLYIKPTSANGQPIGGGPGESSMADEDAAMDEEMGAYRGAMGVSALVTLGILAVLVGVLFGCADLYAAPRDLSWAQARTCSGGAVSNYVAASAPQQVFHVEINNLTGATLYLLVFDSATNQLAGATPHFSAVPIPTGSVGGKTFGSSGAPFHYGVNICLSQTPFSLTNATSGGTATVIHNRLQ